MTGIAYAQEQAASGASGASYQMFIPLLLMIVIIYFFIIRPQQKKEKDRLNMIQSLNKGDKVITISGIYGVIDSFGPADSVFIKVAGNTKIEFSKSAIQSKV